MNKDYYHQFGCSCPTLDSTQGLLTPQSDGSVFRSQPESHKKCVLG